MALVYRLKLQPPAQKALRLLLPEHLSREAAELILDLRSEPYPQYSEPLLRELQGRRKIRLNGWRILYSVSDADHLVIVWDIRPRNANTYLNLP
jgi:mRNA-degrading endonuclease RelE of RelBE toxin-antitoxin system